MSENSRQTIIAEGTQFDGKLKSDCGVTLSGKLKGDVSAPSLIVQPTGAVDGRVEVSTLKSEGEVSGQIIAEDVRLSGRVGDKTTILAATLEVKLSKPQEGLQVTFGECELHVGKTQHAIDKQGRQQKSGTALTSKVAEPVGQTKGGL